MKRTAWLVGLVVLAVASVAVPAGAAPLAAADHGDDDFAFLTFTQDDFFYELKITNGAGSKDRRPLSRPIISRPAYSPDGTRIAYSGPITDGTDGRWAIFVVNVDGTGLQQLTDPELGDFDPAWSANGDWIAFSRNTEGNMDADSCCIIKRMRANGTQVKTIPGTRSGINPTWDPSGTRLAYERHDGIYVTNLDGTGAYRLASGNVAQPAWSPDGSKIAYVVSGGGWQVVEEAASGGPVTVRDSSNHRLESPVWDIDSSTLFYVRYSGEGYEGRSNTTVQRNVAGTPETLFSDAQQIVMLTHAPRPDLACDINGDGLSDVAIGVPDDNEAGQPDAGVVNVLYGSIDGLGVAGNQLWHQGSTGIAGGPGAGDGFGTAVACGDFDGDGFSDVAIGAPGNYGERGEVNVLYGTDSGLSPAGDQRWTQDTPDVQGVMQPGDRFGAALVAGNFDGDGYDDLAIGVPGEDLDAADAGAVNVLYGSASGLGSARNQLWTQDRSDITGIGNVGDAFGSALTAGDFDGDGRDDLAIGVPFEDIKSVADMGAVNVIYGTGTGLRGTGNQLWHQNKANMKGAGQAGDQFGTALAAGDFDADNRDDLAVGVPFEDIADVANTGAVNVLYGAGSGLTAAGTQMWKQDTAKIVGVGRPDDNFGGALATGDFNGDRHADLAIGVPQDRDTKGAANVILGANSGLNAAGNRLWHQDSSGISGTGEAGDNFGSALTVGDFDGGGFMDLAIGVPHEGISGAADTGIVQVIFGSPSALTAARDQTWHQNSTGILGAAGVGDHFGAALR
jgi:hypothetical protein